MAVRLKRLVASGIGRNDAEIVFDDFHCLIRGPSDTGKSHVRECIGYLLGGERAIKRFPENEGYDTLTLEFVHDSDVYAVTKALVGGSARIMKLPAEGESETIDEDIGEFLVKLSGAAGKQIIRSKSKRGAVTGGDLRHWFLISQTDVIADHPTTGVASAVDRIQRAAAFYVVLTGRDDAAVVLAKTKSEKDSISGQILAADSGIRWARSGLPPELAKADVAAALDRVDETLGEITRQYEARATQLRSLRQEIASSSNELRAAEQVRSQSQAMVYRFNMLNAKYQSDLDRLGAADEGIAYFQTLRSVPCPLCNTPIEQQASAADLKQSAPANYRLAVRAEAAKIRALMVGLNESRSHEAQRVAVSTANETRLRGTLENLERSERQVLTGLRVEFSSDPKELAVRRSELSSQLNLFEEIERLQVEINRLKEMKSSKASPILREASEQATHVALIAKGLLIAWGFKDVRSVELDLEECDLTINGRARLSYGAGRRAVSLAAMSIAMLQNSLTHALPHIGFVVIDSPLKAYADPKNRETNDVAPSTVRDNFFLWLSEWAGPGQVVVLENELVVDPTVAATLRVIEFTGTDGVERPGFYPKAVELLSATSPKVAPA